MVIIIILRIIQYPLVVLCGHYLRLSGCEGSFAECRRNEDKRVKGCGQNGTAEQDVILEETR